LLQNHDKLLNEHIAFLWRDSCHILVSFAGHILRLKVNESMAQLRVLRTAARLHLQVDLELPRF
jgi:hypothetical protein